MKSCQNIEAAIGPWLDGELTAKDAEAMRLHLEECAVCAEERRQLERLQLTLKQTMVAKHNEIAFEPFWRGVQHRIIHEKPWHRQVGGWLQDLFAGQRLAWAVPAAIIVALAFASVNSFVPGFKGGAPRDNSAAVESIDAHGRNVALLREDDTKTAVIWLYQNQESDDEPAENTEAKPSF
jgi:anti-sigma factor RsiW